MKYFILFSLIFSGCASARNPIQKEMTIRPGEVRWLEMELSEENLKLFCRDQEQKFQRVGNRVQAVVMESYFSELSPFTCTFKEGDQVLGEVFFKVEDRAYKAEQLRVDGKRIKLNPKDQRRADAEQKILNQIWASSMNQLLFNTPFQGPMTSTVTSYYGTRRVYNGQKKGQHLGIDYRAAIGDKVPSANAGKVVYAGDLFYTGWTVIIDHGLDIFTVYGHLSKPLVKAGEMVKKGQLIGLSGNTGRTSGPHLHWGVKVQNQYIDGFVLVDETKKAFKE